MTTFNHPLIAGNDTGSERTRTTGFVTAVKKVRLDASTKAKTVYLPPNSTVLSLSSQLVSALAGGGDAATAALVSFGNGTDADFYGSVVVSALTRVVGTVTVSSAAIGPAGANVTIGFSAEATSVFTGGAVDAFITFISEHR